MYRRAFTPAFAIAALLPTAPAERAAARAAYLMWRGQMGNRLVWLAVLAALTYAGMSTLYFGKPFGTFADYLGAFFWGSTSKIGLDVTASALAAFRVPKTG